MRIYLIGALKNPIIPKLTKILMDRNFEVFSEWFSPGPNADDYWMEYTKKIGLSHKQAMNSYHVWNVFNFDKTHLDRSDTGIMVMPAGKSGHSEFGYLAGQGKPVYILYDGIPERYDIMQRFAADFFYSVEELLEHFK